MDVSLIITAVTTFLAPYLQKTGEAVAEKVGEKLVENSTWRSIKNLFSKEEKLLVKKIEDTSYLTSNDVHLIESKIRLEIEKNPNYLDQLKDDLNITSLNESQVVNKLISINKLNLDIQKREGQLLNAGPATKGDYINLIEEQTSKLEYQISELKKIIVL